MIYGQTIAFEMDVIEVKQAGDMRVECLLPQEISQAGHVQHTSDGVGVTADD